MRPTRQLTTVHRLAVATLAVAGLTLGAAACAEDDGTVEVDETVLDPETEVLEEEVPGTLEPTDTGAVETE
jgi:hypothetical protein